MTNPITGAAKGALQGATGQLDAKKGRLESKVVYSKAGLANGQDIVVNVPEGYTLTGGGLEAYRPVTTTKNRPTDDGMGWVVNAAGDDGYGNKNTKVWSYVVGTRIVY
ncbi:hypothetical protein ACIBO2_29480 [Nonomuraea sp. NPDC050022]|uniref:hypothetical protein n=1 Tax=unclassified Nonomuraea TaxID=2593643 RepID=UPI0033CC005A